MKILPFDSHVNYTETTFIHRSYSYKNPNTTKYHAPPNKSHRIYSEIVIWRWKAQNENGKTRNGNMGISNFTYTLFLLPKGICRWWTHKTDLNLFLYLYIYIFVSLSLLLPHDHVLCISQFQFSFSNSQTIFVVVLIIIQFWKIKFFTTIEFSTIYIYKNIIKRFKIWLESSGGVASFFLHVL